MLEEEEIHAQDENFDDDMSNLSSEKMKGDELKELQDYYEKLRNREIHAVAINQSAALLKLKELIDSLMNDLRSKSRTAKLWLTYIDCINTLKLFILKPIFRKTVCDFIVISSYCKFCRYFSGVLWAIHSFSFKLFRGFFCAVDFCVPWFFVCRDTCGSPYICECCQSKM